MWEFDGEKAYFVACFFALSHERHGGSLGLDYHPVIEAMKPLLNKEGSF